MSLPSPSEEQQEIINSVVRGYNVKVDAVAGAGKSTTLLLTSMEIMKVFNNWTLILTYNRKLKDELAERVKKTDLDKHLAVYTYHGYASKLYGRTINNDLLMRKAIEGGRPVMNIQPMFILLDEVQDMNPDYHKLVSMIVKQGSLLVLVGDRRQCINEYLDASSDYLVNYSKYFDTGRPWRELTLRTSYRLTPAIAKFVNTHILNQDLIIAGNTTRNNIKPVYHYGVWNLESLIKTIRKKYEPDDIVVMTPTTKSVSNPRTPLGKLLKKKNNGLLFYIKDDESENTDPLITKNKIVISTYHSMKGLERKCTILVGFDESYFEYMDRTWPREEKSLPNIMYVAATRSTEAMYIIQDKEKAPLRTIMLNILPNHCSIKGTQKDIKSAREYTLNRKTVTDALRHRNVTDIANMIQLITVTIEKYGDEMLNYNNSVQFKGYYEDMRRYYGILVPLYAEYLRSGSVHLSPVDDDIKGMEDICDKYNILLLTPNKTLKQWMELVVSKSALDDGCHFYVDQITNYDWVDEDFVNKASSKLLDVIPDVGIFEHRCSGVATDDTDARDYNLLGVFDYITSETIWEFKCTLSITDEHKIQCAAYLALNYMETGFMLTGKVFNVRSGEILNIELSDPDALLEILSSKFK